MRPDGAARVDPRVPAASIPAITGLRLSPGDTVELLNLSRSGMLVEGKTRFVPGTRVTVTIEGSFTPSQLRAKIVRCQVASISGGALRYQCGLQFDQPLERLPNEQAAAGGQPETATAPPVAEPARPQLVNRW